MAEQWKYVEGHEGRYKVGSLGKVLSCIENNRRGQRILKYVISHKGYCLVPLFQNGKTNLKSIHILVWDAFGDGSREGFTIDHKDGNKLNNGIDNLQRLTRYDNSIKYFESHKRKYDLPMGVKQISNGYMARICHNNITIYLGYHKTPELASQAYLQARLLYKNIKVI